MNFKYHSAEQSKLTSIHLCGLKLKESVFSIPLQMCLCSGQMKAAPEQTKEVVTHNYRRASDDLARRAVLFGERHLLTQMQTRYSICKYYYLSKQRLRGATHRTPCIQRKFLPTGRWRTSASCPGSK